MDIVTVNNSSEQVQRREKLQKWIRYSSLVMILIYVTRFILSISLFDFDSPDNSFTIPFSLAVAYCGIIGSQRMHRDMLACFYTCCYLSICLYFVNVLIQSRDLVHLKQDPEASQNDFLLYYIALALETLLAVSQLLGALWGKELVLKHLNFRFVERGFPASFRSEYVQRSPIVSSGQKHRENVLYTINCIPEIVYESKAKNTQGNSTNANVVSEIDDRDVEMNVQVEFDTDMCVICQDEFADGVLVKRLPCGHLYHSKCVNEWLERSLCCPMCMESISLLQAPQTVEETETERSDEYPQNVSFEMATRGQLVI